MDIMIRTGLFIVCKHFKSSLQRKRLTSLTAVSLLQNRKVLTAQETRFEGYVATIIENRQRIQTDLLKAKNHPLTVTSLSVRATYKPCPTLALEAAKRIDTGALTTATIAPALVDVLSKRERGVTLGARGWHEGLNFASSRMIHLGVLLYVGLVQELPIAPGVESLCKSTIFL